MVEILFFFLEICGSSFSRNQYERQKCRFFAAYIDLGQTTHRKTKIVTKLLFTLEIENVHNFAKYQGLLAGYIISFFF
jgi:hypothetical protein